MKLLKRVSKEHIVILLERVSKEHIVILLERVSQERGSWYRRKERQ